ncbi:hypothetical protein [Streptococcus mitis]|uniref:hypothetical protein n=1 Tax=Streptococcus mitis TaxID=28037 RepID=UPI00191281A6|nr:hypothetical protein [Streptococcus mitis]QQQ34754.1 hypothetical protein JJN14_06760 [Streptococcus mitis]DAR63837.1 MAG TPA: hypothetical protein [Caudoviricetes sp.]
MRPKRYPFSGAKKESETKKISLMLKKVDESNLKGSVCAEPLPLYRKTRVYVEIEGYGKKIKTEFKTDDMVFSKKTSFFKRALFKRAEMMSQFDFRESTTEEWNRIILELLEYLKWKTT